MTASVTDRKKFTVEEHPPADLALYHKNPRKGDVSAIKGSLRYHSQYRPVVVNRGTHTGRPLEVLAGNHTVLAFRELALDHPDDDRWQQVSCSIVDVDDDNAARIVAADNRTADLGTYDDQLLAELLAELPDLDGTGYDPGDLAALQDVLAGPPDLDDLADKYGEPEDEDFHTTLRLSVEKHLADQWAEHRRGFASDGDALEALLDQDDES